MICRHTNTVENAQKSCFISSVLTSVLKTLLYSPPLTFFLCVHPDSSPTSLHLILQHFKRHPRGHLGLKPPYPQQMKWVQWHHTQTVNTPLVWIWMWPGSSFMHLQVTIDDSDEDIPVMKAARPPPRYVCFSLQCDGPASQGRQNICGYTQWGCINKW